MNSLIARSMLVGGLLALAPLAPARADDVGRAVSSAWERVRADGGRVWMTGRIKAAFADRKDISGRLIRVRYDGEVVQLAGFVPDRAAADAAEALAGEIAKPARVVGFWVEDSTIGTEEPYKTHVGEQRDDAVIKARVLLSLKSPAVTPQFKAADVVYVQVTQGAVVVYLVADEPSSFDLDPYVAPIEGVRSFSVRVVNAF
ncbi:MAG TPA: BON domain-containing protein [Kiritimatiellia bacterium]|nr:BON domain-containing protein [Kiritimatiellia bacterium]